MPTFDRKAALEAGWSEAEIDKFLAQQPAASPAIGTVASRAEPPPDEPGLEDTSFDLLPFLTAGAGALARPLVGMAGSAASRIAANAGRGLVRGAARTVSAPVIRRIPGTAMVRGMAKDVAMMTAPKAAPKAGAKAAPKVAPAAKAAQRKPARPKKAAPKPGSAESRVKRSTPLDKPGRVASRVRNTEPRARAQGPRPVEFARTHPQSLEDMLRLSVGLEDEMAAIGLSEADKALLRQQARRIVSGTP